MTDIARRDFFKLATATGAMLAISPLDTASRLVPMPVGQVVTLEDFTAGLIRLVGSQLIAALDEQNAAMKRAQLALP